MNDHHPVQETETSRPVRLRRRRKKKPWFNQGWIWHIVAVIGIGVVYFGLSDIKEQMSNASQLIQENTEAIKAQSHVLSEIKQGIQQLILTIKDSVNDIMQSI